MSFHITNFAIYFCPIVFLSSCPCSKAIELTFIKSTLINMLTILICFVTFIFLWIQIFKSNELHSLIQLAMDTCIYEFVN